MISGQTPLDLAEDDEEMEEFLKIYLEELQNGGKPVKPWKFEGPWKSNSE